MQGDEVVVHRLDSWVTAGNGSASRVVPVWSRSTMHEDDLARSGRPQLVGVGVVPPRGPHEAPVAQAVEHLDELAV